MEYLDFSKEMARMAIKRGKGEVNLWRGAFYLNLIGVIINIASVSYGSHVVNAICAGVLIGNLLWIIANLMASKEDLRLDRERLANLDKYSEEKNIDGMIQQLESTKEYYDSLSKIAVETQNRINNHLTENKS